MADDFDVDALLEEPYLNRDKEQDERRERGDGDNGRERRSRSRSGGRRSRDIRSGSQDRRSRDSKRSRSRERRRSRSRDRKERVSAGSGGAGGGGRRSRSRDRGGRRRRSPSYDRSRRSWSRERRRSRSRDRRPGGRISPRGRSPPRRGMSPRRSPRRSPPRFGGRYQRSRSRTPEVLLTPEEKDARTIFIMQLSQRVRARDVEEFFSSVGKIRDVKLIICNKTKRFKGICYVEFRDLESVPLALGLNGQKLLGVPVIVQPSQAEKNRVGNYSELARIREKGQMRLYVGSLHFNITEEMLRGIFEPFGSIQSVQLIMDPETGRSKGYGFVTYNEAEDAKKALEQLNGFELAGRAMKVGHVTEHSDLPGSGGGPPGFDSDELDRSGVNLGATGRLALMAKLAEGTGMKLPLAASQALSTAAAQNVPLPQRVPSAQLFAQQQQQQQLAQCNPPIATQCFMLSNMFDPAQETNLGWDLEVRDDVIEECNKYGGILHIYVDKASPLGHIYAKCPNVATAVSAVNALHGRWFAGKVITAAYVPLINYHNLFPDSMSAVTPLQTKR